MTENFHWDMTTYLRDEKLTIAKQRTKSLRRRPMLNHFTCRVALAAGERERQQQIH